MNLIARLINNSRGNARGYGACLRCGDSWMWKKYHVIKLSPSTDVFMMCTDCWPQASMDERRFAADTMLARWTKQGTPRTRAMTSAIYTAIEAD